MRVFRENAFVIGSAALALLVGACSDSTGPGPSPLGCAAATPTQLAPGAHLEVDPTTQGGCVRLPAAGANGAEHLLVALSATGQVTTSGLQAPYDFSGNEGGLTASASASMQALQIPPPSPAQRFHEMLRARARDLAQQGVGPMPSVGRVPSFAITSPPVGSQRTFQVCAARTCSSFVTVTATLDHVGPHGLLYLDNAAPANGYTAADLGRLGSLFDNFMYPIDTTSFGRETDLDGNGAVIILLSPAVNHLSPNCNASGSVVLGFFFPDDLVPGSPGSNGGEIFYGLVPDPGNSTCSIDRNFALQGMGSTFLHEFQHMISFGRHVVLAHGQAEDNWLDEGLSRLAEELGGREIPDSFCSPDSCISTYAQGDVQNAFEYLQKDTLEASPLIEPGNVDGTLPENGAKLVVRALAGGPLRQRHHPGHQLDEGAGWRQFAHGNCGHRKHKRARRNQCRLPQPRRRVAVGQLPHLRFRIHRAHRSAPLPQLGLLVGFHRDLRRFSAAAGHPHYPAVHPYWRAPTRVRPPSSGDPGADEPRGRRNVDVARRRRSEHGSAAPDRGGASAMSMGSG